LAGDQGFRELSDFLGVGEGHGCMGGNEQPNMLGLEVESVRSDSVQVQRAQPVAFDEQLDGKHAVRPKLNGAAGECRPTGLSAEVGHPHNPVLVGRVQAGPLPGGTLQSINPAGKVTRRDFGINPLPTGDQANGRIGGAGDELDGGRLLSGEAWWP
jgi:hypothetical protein